MTSTSSHQPDWSAAYRRLAVKDGALYRLNPHSLGATPSAGRRDALIARCTHPKLRAAIEEIYRQGAAVGDGGVADAVRVERATGKTVGGKAHAQKLRNFARHLESLAKRLDMGESDLEILRSELADMYFAADEAWAELSYFDGDTTNGQYHHTHWTGRPHASTTVLLAYPKGSILCEYCAAERRPPVQR